MKQIPLTKGFVALVSEEDFQIVSKFKWCASIESRGGRKVYAIRRENGEKIRMHRFIMGLKRHHKRVVDHLNSDGLDNRRENLEVVRRLENMRRAKGWKGSRVYCEKA